MNTAEIKQNQQLLIISVTVGSVILLIKFVAFFLTNSNAILSDALESIINVAAGALGLYAFNIAYRPQDRNHPYGHGKIEFLSAGFEGALILAAGIIIIGKAVYNFIHPQEIQKLQWGVLLVGIAGLINFVLGFILEKRGKNSNSQILLAGGKHLKSDAYSSAGLVLGVILTWISGWVILDNICAIIFGIIIIFTGYRLVENSIAGIMDKADYDLISKMVVRLNEMRKPYWIDIHNLRIIKYGSKYHIDCHVTVPWYYDINQGHDAVELFEETMKSIDPSVLEIFVHTDPCAAQSCKLCTISDCPVRQHPFVRQIDWNLDNVMYNKKHVLPEDEPE